MLNNNEPRPLATKIKCGYLRNGICLKLSDDTVQEPCVEGPCPFDVPTYAAELTAWRALGPSPEAVAERLRELQAVSSAQRF